MARKIIESLEEIAQNFGELTLEKQIEVYKALGDLGKQKPPFISFREFVRRLFLRTAGEYGWERGIFPEAYVGGHAQDVKKGEINLSLRPISYSYDTVEVKFYTNANRVLCLEKVPKHLISGTGPDEERYVVFLEKEVSVYQIGNLYVEAEKAFETFIRTTKKKLNLE